MPIPYKSRFGTKQCEQCGVEIRLHVQRDIERKRFCSRKCNGKWMADNGKLRGAWDKAAVAMSSPQSNAKKGHRGEKHPQYIRDRAQVKARRPQYENRQWIRLVFERDNYTCQICGVRPEKGKNIRLCADHIKPYCRYPESRWDVDNGRTLCDGCHKGTPTYGRKALIYACAE